MPRTSAGILVYRTTAAGVEFLLVHPGGPIWQKRDAGAWTIPKGEIEPGEDDLAAARREFAEETGVTLAGPFVPLGEVKQKGGKTVRAWACAAELDPSTFQSNSFNMEWPPDSGQIRTFPEVDRAEYFTLDQARHKINAAQAAFLERLRRALAHQPE